MWRVFNLTEKLHIGGCVLLLGGFDGAHVGHRILFERAKAFGVPVGVTAITGGKGLPLFTAEERRGIFSRLKADFAVEMEFADICALSAETFGKELVKAFAPKAFLCGDDFRFGCGACGTPESLERSTRVRVEKVGLIQVDGEKVSASAIKKRLGNGETQAVARLLGEPFFLIGEVEKDRGIGRTIGFPTANIRYPKEKFPLKKGVYETSVEIDGRTYKAITNFGARPTFSDESVWTETHLIGFDGELYGKKLCVKFLRYLRDIQKFDGAEGLIAQLKQDIRRVTE